MTLSTLTAWYNRHHSLFPGHFYHPSPQKNQVPIDCHPPFPQLPQTLATTRLLSVSRTCLFWASHTDQRVRVSFGILLPPLSATFSGFTRGTVWAAASLIFTAG